MGSGIGSMPLPKLLKAIQAVLEAAPSAGFKVAAKALPLALVTRAWAATDPPSRIILRP
jgi:hypothetical protein